MISKELHEISTLLMTQDNDCTRLPMFVVQQRIRVYGIDTKYVDSIAWIYADEAVEVSSDEYEELESKYQETLEEPCDYIRTGYHDTWEFVTLFFTREAAEQYIKDNKHRLTDPRVWVDSGYRNHEWELVRNHLMSLTKIPENS